MYCNYGREPFTKDDRKHLRKREAHKALSKGSPTLLQGVSGLKLRRGCGTVSVEHRVRMAKEHPSVPDTLEDGGLDGVVPPTMSTSITIGSRDAVLHLQQDVNPQRPCCDGHRKSGQWDSTFEFRVDELGHSSQSCNCGGWDTFSASLSLTGAPRAAERKEPLHFCHHSVETFLLGCSST